MRTPDANARDRARLVLDFAHAHHTARILRLLASIAGTFVATWACVVVYLWLYQPRLAELGMDGFWCGFGGGTSWVTYPKEMPSRPRVP
jgi:hypothetical protein